MYILFNMDLDNAPVRSRMAVGPPARASELASAIVIVDAIAWHGGDVKLLEPLLRQVGGPQLVIRALLFRQLSDEDPSVGRYEIATEALERYVRLRP